jgi:hypothetical protein
LIRVCNGKYLRIKSLSADGKVACFDNYRKPTSLALELKKKYPVAAYY